MADKFLTLLDITKQNGTDAAVGLVEENRDFAPEISVLKGRPIKGTSYTASVRVDLPSGGPAFRRANEGSDLLASQYDQRLNQCFFMDGQMQVDEMVAKASEFGVDTVLAREAIGVFRRKVLNLGSQIYYGTAKDAKGFPGYVSLYDVANMDIIAQAKGSLGATTSSAWLVVNEPDAVELIYGENAGLDMGTWMRQQVKDANGKSFMAWVNNLSGLVGLSMNYTKSLCRIKNLNGTTGLTDALVAKALSFFPVGTKPTHLFCNRLQRYMLQQSRTPVAGAVTAGLLNFAPTPTESNGIPLFVTDSLTNTEAASNVNSLT